MPGKKEKNASQEKSYLKAVPLTRRLTFRIPARLLLMTAVVISIMVVVLGTQTISMVQDMTRVEISTLAKNNAALSSDYLNTMQARAQALASSLTDMNDASIQMEHKVDLTKKMMESVLEDDRIFSVYTAWEPNAFIPDTPNGQSYYYYRNGSSILLDELNDYSTYGDSDYYAPAKTNQKPHMTEPYSYDLSNGKRVWLITISNPILSSSGEFLGVANCDIVVDTINSLSFEMGEYSEAYTYLLSSKGVYLANSKDPSLMGTELASGGINDEILSVTKQGQQQQWEEKDSLFGKECYIVHIPVTISGIDTPLSSAFVVTKDDALREVYWILALLIGIGVLGIIGIGIGIVITLRRALRPIGTIISAAEHMEQGNLHVDYHVNSSNELGYLSEVFQRTAFVLQGYIQEISALLTRLAEGDMRISVEQEYVGDFAPIRGALERISESLNSTLSRIGLAADQVGAGASQVSDAAQALASGATEQAATVEQLSASVVKISEQAEENRKNVEGASRLVDEANQSFDLGISYMKRLEESMRGIDDASSQISTITKVIEDIASQTNILALNAAIEAARAGAAGKGFAVVADEVRVLAAKSSEAVKQTELLIQKSAEMVAEGTKITDDTAAILKEIVENAGKIGKITNEIARAPEEQTSAIEQVSTGLSQVSAVVQTNAATAEESSASSQELSAQAETLRSEIGGFRLRDEHPSESIIKEEEIHL